jgi:hypothetical protein
MTDHSLAESHIARRLTLVTAALFICGCSGLLPEAGWKVDVANADRPLMISIATDRAAWMWLVAPDEHLVLFREPEALQGSIELIDPDGCVLYDEANLLPTSFTIVPVRRVGEPTDFVLNLVPGAPFDARINTDYSTGCSG